MIRPLPGEHERSEMPEIACLAFADIVEHLTYPDLRMSLSNALASPSSAIQQYAAQNVGRMWRRAQ